MKVTQTTLEGVLIIEGDIYRDSRGHFLELWRGDRYSEAGVTANFVQDNVSFSQKKVLRGLHYQYPHAQSKLVTVLAGEIYDVAVDIRKNSKTFGQWVAVTLSSEKKTQLFVPHGYAHGFCVTSENALVVYKCDEYYSVDDEHTIIWSDQSLAVAWPFTNPVVSDKDANGLKLTEIPDEQLPSD